MFFLKAFPRGTSRAAMLVPRLILSCTVVWIIGVLAGAAGQESSCNVSRSPSEHDSSDGAINSEMTLAFGSDGDTSASLDPSPTITTSYILREFELQYQDTPQVEITDIRLGTSTDCSFHLSLWKELSDSTLVPVALSKKIRLSDDLAGRWVYNANTFKACGVKNQPLQSVLRRHIRGKIHFGISVKGHTSCGSLSGVAHPGGVNSPVVYHRGGFFRRRKLDVVQHTIHPSLHIVLRGDFRRVSIGCAKDLVCRQPSASSLACAIRNPPVHLLPNETDEGEIDIEQETVREKSAEPEDTTLMQNTGTFSPPAPREAVPREVDEHREKGMLADIGDHLGCDSEEDRDKSEGKEEKYGSARNFQGSPPSEDPYDQVNFDDQLPKDLINPDNTMTSTIEGCGKGSCKANSKANNVPTLQGTTVATTPTIATLSSIKAEPSWSSNYLTYTLLAIVLFVGLWVGISATLIVVYRRDCARRDKTGTAEKEESPTKQARKPSIDMFNHLVTNSEFYTDPKAARSAAALAVVTIEDVDGARPSTSVTDSPQMPRQMSALSMLPSYMQSLSAQSTALRPQTQTGGYDWLTVFQKGCAGSPNNSVGDRRESEMECDDEYDDVGDRVAEVLEDINDLGSSASDERSTGLQPEAGHISPGLALEEDDMSPYATASSLFGKPGSPHSLQCNSASSAPTSSFLKLPVPTYAKVDLSRKTRLYSKRGDDCTE